MVPIFPCLNVLADHRTAQVNHFLDRLEPALELGLHVVHEVVDDLVLA